MSFGRDAFWASKATVFFGGMVATFGLIFRVSKLVDLAFNPLFWVVMFVIALFIRRARSEAS